MYTSVDLLCGCGLVTHDVRYNPSRTNTRAHKSAHTRLSIEYEVASITPPDHQTH